MNKLHISRMLTILTILLLGTSISPLYAQEKEPYAVFTDSDKTLTFYYDTLRASRNGEGVETYDLNNGNNLPEWTQLNGATNSWGMNKANKEPHNYEIKCVVFDKTFSDARPTSTYHWFHAMSYSHYDEEKDLSEDGPITIIGLENLNTSEVKNMCGMFRDCNLDTLDLRLFDTSKVEDMSSMFSGCYLTTLDLSSFGTAEVTNMNSMFRGCSKLTSLDLTFDTSNVKDIGNMFSWCESLTSLDLSSFDISKIDVTKTNGFLVQCIALDTLIISKSMNKLNGGTCSGVGTEKNPCTIIAPSGFNFGVDTSGPFKWRDGWFVYKPIEAYAVYTANDNTLTFYYDTLRAERTGETYDLNKDGYSPGWVSEETEVNSWGMNTLNSTNHEEDISRVIFDSSFKGARPNSTKKWFYNMYNLTSIEGWENLNTSEVVDMTYMFWGCNKLETIDLSHFKTSNVESMSEMFKYCEKIESIDLNRFDTSKVREMKEMFNSCKSLETLNLSNFEIKNNAQTDNLLSNCTSLDTLIVSNTMMGLADNACNMVGTQDNPCTIIAPDGFDFGVEDTSKPFQWKSGWFKLGVDEPEAYAVYEKNTLTFYYDTQRAERTGETYDLNNDSTAPAWLEHKEEITTVVFDRSFANDSVRPTTTHGWFNEMSKLAEIKGLEYLNTSEVTDMGAMFCNCESLINLDLSTFKTSNVTYMRNLFMNCSSLESLDISSFETSNVTDMSGMFFNDSTLVSLDLSRFNTSKVEKMGSMFSTCTKLESLDLSNFDTRNVTVTSNMFFNCSSLTTLDLSTFNTSKVTDIGGMFYGCSKLKTLILGKDFKTSEAQYMHNMFGGCSSLVKLDLSNFDISKSAQSGTGGLLENCSSLTELSISETMYLLNDNACKGVGTVESPCKLIAPDNFDFGSCEILGSNTFKWKNGVWGFPSGAGGEVVCVPYAVYDGNENENVLTFYNDNLQILRNGENKNVYSLNNGNEEPQWLEHKTDISIVEFDSLFAKTSPTTTSKWFEGMSSLKTIHGMENLNTSAVTDMSGMFSGCSALTSLDVSKFKTSDVKSMKSMFGSCSSLESIEYSQTDFNTANVEDMSYMFSGCSALSSLDLSNYNTGKVVSMDSMFYGCSALKSLDVSKFNTSDVKSMKSMFDSCSSLESIDYSLEYFNTANVEDMSYMFSGCSALKGLDVTQFNTAKVKDMSHMFSGCKKLDTLDLVGFEIKDKNVITEYFLQNCSGLTELSISPSMTNLAENACDGVGQEVNPCTIIAPEGFDFGGVTTSDASFLWKGGYFTLGEKETYAVYEDSTLTFYFDNQKGQRSGNKYTLNTDSTDPDWLKETITTVTFDTSFKDTNPKITYKWFYNLTELISIVGIENLNTSAVKDMSHMFSGCSAFTTLDLSKLNIPENEDIKTDYLLYNCSGLSQLSISSSMTNLADNACEGVGTEVTPCNLIAPEDFKFGSCVILGYNTFKWKSGIWGFPSGEGGEVVSVPYAVYDGNENVKSLTFYYDNLQTLRKGENKNVYSLNNENEAPQWLEYKTDISTVKFDSLFAKKSPTTTSKWFKGMSNLTEIKDIAYLNTSAVTDMTGMFSGCSKLTALNISNFKTSNVKSMKSMFDSCSSLESIEYSQTDFNTGNVEDMSYVFSGCSALKGLDVTQFNTEKVTDMSYMFSGCEKLDTLDLGGFEIPDNKTQYFLQNCSGLKKLYISSSMTKLANNACDSVGRFENCTIIPPDDKFDFGVDTSKGSFEWKGGKFRLQNSGSETSDVKNKMYAVYNDYTLRFYFDNEENNKNGDKYELNEGNVSPGWKNKTIQKVVFDSSFEEAKPTSTYKWFNNLTSLTEIDGLNYLHTNSVTTMNGMFDGCSALTGIDVSSFSTEKVTDMSYMFRGCEKLDTLDLEKFDVANRDTRELLNGCTKLYKLYISESMTTLSEDACKGVGTETYPCRIVPPTTDFNFGVDTNGVFPWKEGYFTLSEIFTITVSVKGNKKATFGKESEVLYSINDKESIQIDEDKKQFNLSKDAKFALVIQGDNVIKLSENGEDKTIQYLLTDKTIQYQLNIVSVEKNDTVEIIFPDAITTQNGINYLLSGSNAYVNYSRSFSADSEKSQSQYRGAIKIPDAVTLEDKNYSVTEIMEQAFVGWENMAENGDIKVSNDSLMYVILPKTLQKIRAEAFANCTKLKYVEIPGESLKEIGDKAFNGSDSIANIRIRTSPPPLLSENAFDSFQFEHVQIYVPDESNIVNDYKEKDGWKKFKDNIIGAKMQYKLTISAGENGKVVWYNDTIKSKEIKTVKVWGRSYGLLHFIPDENHTVETLKINGKEMDSFKNPYPLENITKNDTIEVTFSSEKSYNLTVEVIGNESVTILIPEYDQDYIVKDGEKTIKDLSGGWKAVKYDSSKVRPGKIVINGIDEMNNGNVIELKGDGLFNFKLDKDTKLQILLVDNNKYFTIDGITYGIVKNENSQKEAKILYGDCKEYVKIYEDVTNKEGDFQGVFKVVEVADHAFSFCPGLWAVSLPSSVKTIGNNLFTGSGNIAALEVQSEDKITISYEMLGNVVNNPNFLLYVPAKSYNNTSVQNVVVGTDNNYQADSIVISDAEEGNNFYCPKEFKTDTISYTHYYKMESGIGEGNSQGWETIVLPFDVKNIQHVEKGNLTPFKNWNPEFTNMKPFWLYTLSSSGWSEEGEIKANTPYIICMPNNKAYNPIYKIEGDVTFSATNAKVKSSADLIQEDYNKRTFIPTFQHKAEDSIYALNVYNQYVEVYNKDNPKTNYAYGSTFVHNLRDVHPFEAYIVKPNGSNADFYIFDDMPTGIPQLPILPDVSNFQPGNYRVVNLSGQLVRMVEATSPTEAVRNLQPGIYIVNGKKVVVK